jgi:hypothetical protein
MITFRQFEKDERWALHVIKKFIDNHSIMIYVAVSLIILYLLASLSIIMMAGAVGGATVEHTIQEQLCAGEVTIEQYTTTMWAMGILRTVFDFIAVLMDFAIAGLILFWSYIGFKAYLRYNRDNL